ncbi:MAG: hypothetical protein K1X94_12950 [Sandaracinaceae bacterium]|nr:hypothetical protein [Sandaracinaceae bacterium]
MAWLSVTGCDPAPVGLDASDRDAALAEDALEDAGPSGAVARFQPSADVAMAFGDVPFPSDLYLGTDGTYDLASLPTSSRAARIDALLAEVGRQTGACVTCGTHFYVDGALDPASLPARIDALATAPIVMADVDPASPERGRLIALEAQLRPAVGLISVRPVRGVTLARSRRYAVVLTSQLRGLDGSALAPSEAFRLVRDGGESTDPAVLRARERVAPALDELASAGVPRASIVAAAVFTTHDPSALPRQLREVVRAAPRPVASVDVVYPTPTMSLDELLGTPTGGLHGIDIPDTGGAMGERGYLHTTTSRVVVGTFTAPRVIEGSGAELGTLRRDADGRIEVLGTETIPFLLVVPAGADVTSLPVAIFAHGSPRTMQDALGLADTLGQHGIAVLAFDAFQHGGRSFAPVDVETARGRAGSDGIHEHDRATVYLRLYAFQGTPAGLEASVGYLEGTYAQVDADALSVVRLVAEGDLSAIAASDAALAGLAFDPAATYYIGNSFGTFTGTVLLAAEPDLEAVVLNVPGGSVMELLAGGARTREAVEGTLLPLYGIRGSFDEVQRRLALEPIFDLIGWTLEGSDFRALAPYAYLDPVVSGPRPDLLVQSAELDDFVPVWGAQATAAAMGLERIGPFDFVPAVPEASRPVSGNLTTGAGPVTAVAHLWEGAGHGMFAYPEVEIAFEAPIEPPLVALDPPRTITNPTEAVHAEIATFLGTRLATGRARVE